ncbi:MAG: UvrD-helicase domain-containing protein [bacterium]
MPDPLRKDIEIPRSDETIVEASAGSGKTTALTERLAQFLLSHSIPHNKLQNILAITFTNNAAREMKERVLQLLKKAALGDETTLNRFSDLLTLDRGLIQRQAELRVDEILNNYSDFQILTIDSFLARIFKSTAVQFGFPPDFEIVLDSRSLLNEGLQLFARDITQGASTTELLNQLIALLLEGRSASERYLWNPFDDISRKVRDLYAKTVLYSKPLVVEDFSDEIRQESQRLIRLVLELDMMVEQSGLPRQARFEKYVAEARMSDAQRLLDLQMPSPPTKKSKSSLYESWLITIEPLCDTIVELRSRLIMLKARQHFQPYARSLELLQQSLESLKRQHGIIDIADISKRLAAFLTREIIPEIYYGLGDLIHHYLIDEFQDTNPIQWENLYPLIDNALSQGGSIFIVGDMKQSIYGFRGADWKIMRKLIQTNVFPSAHKTVAQLTENYRSYQRILDFTQTVFKEIVPTQVDPEAADASGLKSYIQVPIEKFKGKGYVELEFFEKDTAENTLPEKKKLLDIISSCVRRGYRCRDIAILTPKNQTVITVSGWLNEQNIAFVSHSSLDVRNRKSVGELLALLHFLDSPIDDLSFSTFILGDLFGALLASEESPVNTAVLRDLIVHHRTSRSSDSALYTVFRSQHSDLWARYFDQLFSLTGYVPLYDLVSEMIKHLRVFDILPEEEAAIVKLLEVIRPFEETGENSLKGFLRFADEASDQSDWDIAIPLDVHAVTVMTLHKAKGLGFPVVIVLLYDSRPRSDGYTFIDEGDGMHIVHLTQDIAKHVAELRPWLKEKELNAAVDELNKLYVALTRAREEMYILSVKNDRSTEPSSFLPTTGFEPGTPPRVSAQEQPAEPCARSFHHNQPAMKQSVEYQKIGLREVERGELIHLMLSRINALDNDLHRQLFSLIEQCSIESRSVFDQTALLETLLRFLSNPEVNVFFTMQPGRTILNEHEFVTREGRLQRMDRVILDTDRIIVIDYKTGDENPEYHEQVRGYMNILKEVYPGKQVIGFLAYVDRNVLRAVV